MKKSMRWSGCGLDGPDRSTDAGRPGKGRNGQPRILAQPDEQGMRMTTYPELQLYIGGKWRSGKETIPVLNPADESVIGALPVATRADLDDALEAAGQGFRIWSQTAPAKRAEVILRAVALMKARAEEIARSITLEHGKPIAQARLEVQRGCEFFEWDAGEAIRAYGRVIPSAPDILSAKLRQRSGVGDGALLVFGVPSAISSYLIPKAQVRLVAFTGSTAVGKQLTEIASRSVTPVLMELGGHAPVIVCDDVDPVVSAALCVSRKARNAGQVCTSPTRFFVHKDIYRPFLDAFVERARAIRIGDGFEAGTAKFVIEDEGAIVIDGEGVRAGDDEADVTMTASADTFEAILSGDLNPTSAFMAGKLSVDGDMGLAMKLGSALA